MVSTTIKQCKLEKGVGFEQRRRCFPIPMRKLKIDGCGDMQFKGEWQINERRVLEYWSMGGIQMAYRRWMYAVLIHRNNNVT